MNFQGFYITDNQIYITLFHKKIEKYLEINFFVNRLAKQMKTKFINSDFAY